MNYKRIILLCFALLALPLSAFALTDNTNTQLAVWANEAIVATYTYDYQKYIERQKEIAVYYSATGWISYSKALTDSKLPDVVKKNDYDVSAVAILPPQIKAINNHSWQAIMPLLVVYKNPQYQQKQTLEVTIEFTTTPAGQGVRGLAITSLQSKEIEPPCQCSATHAPTPIARE
jgi:hypothetical protein